MASNESRTILSHQCWHSPAGDCKPWVVPKFQPTWEQCLVTLRQPFITSYWAKSSKEKKWKTEIRRNSSSYLLIAEQDTGFIFQWAFSNAHYKSSSGLTREIALPTLLVSSKWSVSTMQGICCFPGKHGM